MDPERLRARGGRARRAHRRAAARALGSRGAPARLPAGRLHRARRHRRLRPRRRARRGEAERWRRVGGTLEIDSAPRRGAPASPSACRSPWRCSRCCWCGSASEVLGAPHRQGARRGAGRALARSTAAAASRCSPYDGALVPVHDLDAAARLPAARAATSALVVVAEAATAGRIGLAVDALLGQHEAVLKPLGRPLDAVPGLSAVTVLGDGRPVFILDVPRLLAADGDRPTERRLRPARARRAAGACHHRLRPGGHRARRAHAGRRIEMDVPEALGGRGAPGAIADFLGGLGAGPRRGRRRAGGARSRATSSSRCRSATRSALAARARLARLARAAPGTRHGRERAHGVGQHRRERLRLRDRRARRGEAAPLGARPSRAGSGRACVERLVAHGPARSRSPPASPPSGPAGPRGAHPGHARAGADSRSCSRHLDDCARAPPPMDETDAARAPRRACAAARPTLDDAVRAAQGRALRAAGRRRHPRHPPLAAGRHAGGGARRVEDRRAGGGHREEARRAGAAPGDPARAGQGRARRGAP